MQLSLLLLSYLAAAIVSAGVGAAAWRRRRLIGARELALLMFAVAWWLAASALEAASTGLSAKVDWSVVAYPGIEAAPVAYLLFVFAWTRQDGWLTRGRIALLALVPIASVGVAATNGWHHLLWPSVTLIDAWGVTAVYDHGPWFWVEVAYAYALVGAGLIALVVAMYRYPAVYARRFRLVFIATLVPTVASALYGAGLTRTVHADLSSIAFAATGLAGAWAVLRLRLLDVVPVAWPTLLDALADAVLVLDPEQRVAAVSLAATRLLGTAPDAAGQPAAQVLGHVPEVLSACQGTGDREVEVPAPGGLGTVRVAEVSDPERHSRWLNVRVTTIRDERGRGAGKLVVVRDVTERHGMVETIRTLSLTDELTGLLNRRGFVTLAEQQIQSSARTRARLWLLFADIDGLKDINDRLGHAAGDQAIRELASLLREGAFRKADLVARLGGDEFAILATEISRTDAEAMLGRLGEAVRRANAAPGREYALSLSTGAAVFDPARPRTLDELIAEADHRMYEAKQARRTSQPDEGAGHEATAGSPGAEAGSPAARGQASAHSRRRPRPIGHPIRTGPRA